MTDEKTNPQTATLATQKGVLPPRRLQLIGVAGPEDGRRALLRTPSGQIRQVQIGDRVRNRSIVAIADDAVILADNSGRTTALRMPAAAPTRSAA